jgi:hypothetical protein
MVFSSCSLFHQLLRRVPMSTDAGNEIEEASSLPSGCLSWLKPKLPDKLDSASTTSGEKPPSDLRVATPVKEDPKPVSFFTLFRSALVSLHVPLAFL